MSSTSVSNNEKLLRLLYLSNTSPKYISGNPDKYSLPQIDATIFDEYLKLPEEFLKTIETVSAYNIHPQRKTIFYALARFLNTQKLPEEVKSKITKTAIDISKSDEDFFDYLKFCTTFRTGKTKISTCVRKRVKAFYKNKTAEELVDSYILHKSVHGWDHRTLLKLTHIKSDTLSKNLVINYILLNDVKTENIKDETSMKLIENLKEINTLRTTKDVAVALPIINKFKLTHHHLTPFLQKHQEAWNAVISNMSIRDILKSLPKLYRLGFLKQNLEVYKIIVACLTDAEKIKKDQIFPLEIFIALKNFEKGGKPVDPKLIDHLTKEKKLGEEELAKAKTLVEPKCPNIVNNIHKCLSMSYSNIQSTGLKFLITIDVTESMNLPCLHSKNITSIEAALAITLSFLKSEKNVTTALFKDKDIQLINFKSSDSYSDNLKKLKEHKSTYMIPFSGVEWALHKNKSFDVLINFVHHHEFSSAVPKEHRDKISRGLKSIHKYQETVNKSAKIVNICLATSRLVIADESRNIIDIAGLDEGVPKVLHTFLNGKFC
ncbi:unnamed protein product [Brassicogethes aeneus]|uniref:TROVE domain-containing protein n=1 Tax=Brassicogethes aeneus TaxID=1431903 RepID=A0A9P0FJ57_BRAAE|nr:unnamed protein product [Brassicogethes aeneus]